MDDQLAGDCIAVGQEAGVFLGEFRQSPATLSASPRLLGMIAKANMGCGNLGMSILPPSPTWSTSPIRCIEFGHGHDVTGDGLADLGVLGTLKLIELPGRCGLALVADVDRPVRSQRAAGARGKWCT